MSNVIITNLINRVYMEDTDAYGIVYYSRYLQFFERARTEFLRERGYALTELANLNILFLIKQVNLVFSAPARLDDLIEIKTTCINSRLTMLTFNQEMNKIDGQHLCRAQIEVVCVSEKLKPRRVPDLFFNQES